MTDIDLAALSQPLLDTVNAAHREFLAALEPLRPPLYRYCRRLTGNVWDGEDLVQETLTRAFSRAARSHQPVHRPMAWLARIATNAYLDGLRRPAPVPAEPPERAAPPEADPAEVRDALAEMVTLLPPQERAAVLLKDVLDFSLREIAGILQTSPGAVKSALHRGRTRLASPTRAPRPAPDRAVVDALAEAFTAYDLDRLADLFRPDATSEVLGVVDEVGRDRIRAGSLHHTLVLETDVRWRAEVRSLDDEPLVLLWDDGSVGDVLRVETADGAVARLRWYYFCPETLAEVASRLGVPYRAHGYHLPG
jgi:RNA polymerase sigma-70 factor, ECF subfamily